MKKSSIAESVFKVNMKYAMKQNKTKEIFFKYLNEGRSIDDFKAELERLWGTNDIPYLEEQIIEYEAYLHELHTNKKLDKTKATIIGITALGGILATNKLFQKVKAKEYQTRITSYGYEKNKEEYLKKLVPKYTSDVKAYRNSEGEVVRFVKPSTYNSMAYNTCLTRNGWNQTLNDGLDMGVGYYYIPFHNFSCPHCIAHQERAMTRSECMRMLGTANEQEGDILHPNCKCVLTFFTDKTQTRTINREEVEEQYHIREQVMSLELKREEIKSDLKIYKNFGSQEDIDKTKAKLEKVNSSIKELQQQLPTEELRKQVVAR